MLATRISTRRSWAAALLLSALTAAFVILPVPTAEAHRDGCHRWHSCPSDTGSYVCGDLGYYSECPGGKPSKEDSTSTPERDYELPDYEAPDTPHLARSQSQAGGRVTVKVRAEKRSTIRVETDTGKRVAKITASGKEQKINFKAKTGHRTYTVTATDKAGNESLEATTSVNVDATAPALSAVTAVAGTDVTGASSVSFTSDRGAQWTLNGVGPKPLHGTVTDSTTTLQLWLSDGTYKPSLTLRDKIGNIRRATTTMKVRVERPLLRAARTSTSTEPRLAYALSGTPRSTGKLVLANLDDDLPFTIDDHGSANIVLDAADGTYGPGRAILTDFAGRKTTTNIPEAVVDSTAPTLDLTVDQTQAQTGTLALAVATEPGSTVHVTSPLKDTTGNTALLDETMTATAAPTLLTRRPAAGTYTVTATATDAVGNTATRQVDVDVVIPATPTQVALGIAILLWLCALPVGAGILLWQFRGRIGAWRARQAEAARTRKTQRAAKAAEALHQRQLAEHAQALAAHRTALTGWERQRRHLDDLLTTASTFQPTTDAVGLVQLKRNETCYGVYSAVMVEQRTRQGVTALHDVATGRAVITSQRVAFVAEKNREWAFTKLARVIADGPLTVLPVSNRKQPSGLRLASGGLDEFRMRLDLALADRTGDRDDVIARRLQALRLHDQQKPVAPAPPTPPTPLSSSTSAPTTTLR